MANTLQIKRGLLTNLPVLSAGEPAFTTDDGRFHVGDGATNYHYYPGDQSVKTTDDVEFNTVTVSTAPSAGSDLTNKTYVDDLVSKGLVAHEVVLDKDTLDPSGLTPADGDRYWIGGTGAVGTDWEGHDYEIADYNGASWDFETVTDGDMAFVADESVFYYYDDGTTSLKKLTTAIGAHASTHESGGADQIDHDSLSGFVSNEHINHTGVTLTAGTGLTGGGDISTNRTFDVDINGASDLAAPDSADELLLADNSDASSIKKADLASIVDARLSGGTGIDYTNGTIAIDGAVVLQHSDVDDSPSDGSTNVPISSNWAYNHNAASTGVHGAGVETLLHTGSTIDCGSF